MGKYINFGKRDITLKKEVTNNTNETIREQNWVKIIKSFSHLNNSSKLIFLETNNLACYYIVLPERSQSSQ